MSYIKNHYFEEINSADARIVADMETAIAWELWEAEQDLIRGIFDPEPIFEIV